MTTITSNINSIKSNYDNILDKLNNYYKKNNKLNDINFINFKNLYDANNKFIIFDQYNLSKINYNNKDTFCNNFLNPDNNHKLYKLYYDSEKCQANLDNIHINVKQDELKNYIRELSDKYFSNLNDLKKIDKYMNINSEAIRNQLEEKLNGLCEKDKIKINGKCEIFNKENIIKFCKHENEYKKCKNYQIQNHKLIYKYGINMTENLNRETDIKQINKIFNCDNKKNFKKDYKFCINSTDCISNGAASKCQKIFVKKNNNELNNICIPKSCKSNKLKNISQHEKIEAKIKDYNNKIYTFNNIKDDHIFANYVECSNRLKKQCTIDDKCRLDGDTCTTKCEFRDQYKLSCEIDNKCKFDSSNNQCTTKCKYRTDDKCTIDNKCNYVDTIEPVKKGGKGVNTSCIKDRNGNTSCIFDPNICVEKYGQCAIRENEVLNKCGNWDKCKGVVCKKDYNGWCLARGQWNEDPNQTKPNMWGYKKVKKCIAKACDKRSKEECFNIKDSKDNKCLLDENNVCKKLENHDCLTDSCDSGNPKGNCNSNISFYKKNGILIANKKDGINRTIPFKWQRVGKSKSPYNCINKCISKNNILGMSDNLATDKTVKFDFAAIQDGDACFCGTVGDIAKNHYPKHPRIVNRNQCSKIKDDLKDKLEHNDTGGPWRNSIHFLDDFTPCINIQNLDKCNKIQYCKIDNNKCIPKTLNNSIENNKIILNKQNSKTYNKLSYCDKNKLNKCLNKDINQCNKDPSCQITNINNEYLQQPICISNSCRHKNVKNLPNLSLKTNISEFNKYLTPKIISIKNTNTNASWGSDPYPRVAKRLLIYNQNNETCINIKDNNTCNKLNHCKFDSTLTKCLPNSVSFAKEGKYINLKKNNNTSYCKNNYLTDCLKKDIYGCREKNNDNTSKCQIININNNNLPQQICIANNTHCKHKKNKNLNVTFDRYTKSVNLNNRTWSNDPYPSIYKSGITYNKNNAY